MPTLSVAQDWSTIQSMTWAMSSPAAPGIDVARSERGAGAAEVERDEVVALVE